MSSVHSSGAAADASPSSLGIGLLSRRGSRASGSSQVDKEHLSQALDKIHISASQSDTLTTFNEFASPPSASSGVEAKGLTDELMQNGISGLYNRFKGAVAGGKERQSPLQVKEDTDGGETSSLKSQPTSTTPSNKGLDFISSKGSFASLASPLLQATPSSRLQSPTSLSFAVPPSSAESSKQGLKSSTASYQSVSKPSSASRSQIAPLSKSTTSGIIVPTVAPVTVTAFRETDAAQKGHSTLESDSPAGIDKAAIKSPFPTLTGSPHDRRHSSRSATSEKSPTLSEFQDRIHKESCSTSRSGNDQSAKLVESDATARQSTSSNISGISTDIKEHTDLRSDLTRVPKPLINTDGSTDAHVNAPTTLSTTKSSDSQMGDAGGQTTTIQPRVPLVSKRLQLPGYRTSRASSTDRSTAEFSPVTTSAHNNVRHESFSVDDDHNTIFPGYRRIPGTTTSGDSQAVSNRLEQMRKQVLGKEYWMKDDTCKECFLCGSSFSAFRRKHHCRTCGCIFDSKCTSIISGDRFEVPGSLRVCKTCLDIINRRHESSGSDESADDAPVFYSTQPGEDYASQLQESPFRKQSKDVKSGEWDNGRQFTTPMMAIPATRRIGDSSSRKSAVLEIDAPQLPRPSSSRSLKSLSGRPSSGHRRMHSKHNFLGRFKSTNEQRAPFRRDAVEEMGKRSKLSAFHDDNIIDPDLAPYMSDDGSSGDEQISIFAAMNGVGSGGGVPGSSFDTERSGFGSLLTTGKRHRPRPDKSISGISFTSRGIEDGSISGSAIGHSRTGRRRNLSAASNIIHHNRGSPRSNRMGGLIKGIGSLGEDRTTSREAIPSTTSLGPSRMTRSALMRDAKFPPVELNPAMLCHVKNILRQFLQKDNITNARSWEKALLPILLRLVDDVCMNVREGDEIDIRHYVKLKKVPGGRPGDTSYVSGVVFTKKLPLKSMPRSIPNPRIVVVSFSIEYSRQRDNFMSLEPIIAQEQEFLKNLVARIASLRPSLLLVQRHVSGLALQYLAEANITVVYNVKKSVIEAVSRCAETVIISSIDMMTLRPVQVGKSSGFDVKTYVNKDIPGRKKTLVYISGCAKELGCTIVLRGASIEELSRMKRITEYMCYVTYNSMLETSLFRDEFVLIPPVEDVSGSLSPSNQIEAQANPSSDPVSVLPQDPDTEASDKLRNLNELEASTGPENTSDMEVRSSDQGPSDQNHFDGPKLVSAHASHVHSSNVSPEDQVPEDVPMPTFYSDLVAKHQTKILSASPFVKFKQPYLLEKVREQERRLMYLKRLRDQDTFEEQTEDEQAKSKHFQLITPEMVHKTVRGAPKQIMEILHAVHDAEYDKALHNYQTHQRQWENSIQGNVDLFDPFWHQNIVVLYTLVCTETSIPCAGPHVLALEFYNEHADEETFDRDCTLGQWVEDLCLSADAFCTFSSCERRMTEHHRTYVHGEARITVFMEKSPCKLKGLQDSILMWSYCKICNKETQVMPMADSTWKYSFGKYLELSFWCDPLRLRAGFCPHDFHRDHIRFFGYKNIAIRIHYDPIDLLEIVVPRSRITWKVDNDLRLKNELFTRTEERWNRFMASVKSRIKGINIDSVVSDKSAACEAEVEKMAKQADDDHESMIQKLQEKYMESKYYEIIPMNRAVRAMQEKVQQWDAIFADFDKNFFPSEKDIRKLAALQLKRMFMDRDTSTSSLVSADPGEIQSDLDERSTITEDADSVLSSVLDGNVTSGDKDHESSLIASPIQSDGQLEVDFERESIQTLDLALQQTPLPSSVQLDETLGLCETPRATSPLESQSTLTSAESTNNNSPSEDSDATIVPTKTPPIDGAHPEESSVSTPPASLTGIPRPTDRKISRRLGTIVSPPVSRTHSQPVGNMRRIHAPTGMTLRNDLAVPTDPFNAPQDYSRIAVQDQSKSDDRKLAERFTSAMKNPRKVGHSLIPRSVQNRRQDSKVSALAKHFDQLSREFEKERMRDRKQRASTVTQSKGFPRASFKPIVEVYRNVGDAVEERGPSDDYFQGGPIQPNDVISAPDDGGGSLNEQSMDNVTRPPSPTGTVIIRETATETDDHQPSTSQAQSDEDCTASDAENSLLEDLPGVPEIAASLDDNETIAGSELNLELPKHEKTSLMRILTNFWAERSASGWTQLEYPLNPVAEHIFADSDIIIREDEPSSLIAFSLDSDHYKAKLCDIRQQGQDGNQKAYAAEQEKNSSLDPCQDGVNQTEVEQSLLRPTGQHLICRFASDSAKMMCKVFFAEQFDAVRRKCGVGDRIVESLSRCAKWDSRGGKSKSLFLKTLDDRLILKSLTAVETQAFLRFAPAYFNIMAEALFHDLPTVIAKMLGFFSIVVKNPTTGTEIRHDILVMENLFYDRTLTRIFDLKGSMRNRKLQSTGEQNEVLLDENMVEFIYESPLFAREHSKKLLRASVWNDTLFLARQNVMDYSLMVAVDEKNRELVVGIIDCVRTFTWDKKLESWIKDKGFVGGGRNKPTVTSPKEYKQRFREAMARYILEAPNCWHHFKPDGLNIRRPLVQERVMIEDAGDVARVE